MFFNGQKYIYFVTSFYRCIWWKRKKKYCFYKLSNCKRWAEHKCMKIRAFLKKKKNNNERQFLRQNSRSVKKKLKKNVKIFVCAIYTFIFLNWSVKQKLDLFFLQIDISCPIIGSFFILSTILNLYGFPFSFLHCLLIYCNNFSSSVCCFFKHTHFFIRLVRSANINRCYLCGRWAIFF